MANPLGDGARLAVFLLLDDGYIKDAKVSGYRVYDAVGNVKLRLLPRQYRSIEYLLRKKNDKFFINKSTVRSLHNNSWVKQQYLLKKSLKKTGDYDKL